MTTELETQVDTHEVETAKKRQRKAQPEESNICETSASTANKLGVYRIDPENKFELKFQTEQSACFDLAGYFKVGERVKVYQTDDKVIERKITDDGLVLYTGERALVPTGLIFDIPLGFCLEFYARSGTSLKQGLVLNNAPAQIDSDYVNQSYISIANTGASKYIQSGERIAQAKLVRLVETELVELTEAPKQKTSRTGGLGSTGK